MAAKKYWLFKGGEDCNSIADYLAMPGKTGLWKSTRNYTVRNLIRDEMRKGDAVLFYHGNCEIPGVVGIAEVASKPFPDPSQFDSKKKGFDSKATENAPRWWNVDVKVKSQFKETISLKMLRETPGLEEMIVTKRGNRFSITPVTKEEWEIVSGLSK